jgi:hypothetical protein
MKKVNIYVDDDIWQDFRIACIKRNTSASQEIERLMRERIELWNSQAKGSEHERQQPA